MMGGTIIDRNWIPSNENKGNLLITALEVLEHFYAKVGGIWTGCFKLKDSPDCRGAVAAASIVVSTHLIADIG